MALAGPLQRSLDGRGDHPLGGGDAEVRGGKNAAPLHLGAFREESEAGAGCGNGTQPALGLLSEVWKAPRFGLIGEGSLSGMVTDSGDLIVLAVRRGAEGDRRGPTPKQGLGGHRAASWRQHVLLWQHLKGPGRPSQ